MKDSQLIVFVDRLVDKFSDKEAEKSQSNLHICWWSSKRCFAEVSLERFSYVAEETFRKAKNLVSRRKEQVLHDYRYVKWIQWFNCAVLCEIGRGSCAGTLRQYKSKIFFSNIII
jgi:hypothetical protein